MGIVGSPKQRRVGRRLLWFLVGVLAVYGLKWLDIGIWRWTGGGLTPPLERTVNALCMIADPPTWAIAWLTWWMIERERRTGRARDLLLSPLTSREIFWRHVVPLGVWLMGVVLLGEILFRAHRIWVSPRMIEFPSLSVYWSLRFYLPNIILATLTLGCALPLFVCASTLLLPRRMRGSLGIVIPVFATILLRRGLYRLSYHLIALLSVRLRISLLLPLGISPPLFQLWGLGVVIALAAWFVASRFARLLAEE